MNECRNGRITEQVKDSRICSALRKSPRLQACGLRDTEIRRTEVGTAATEDCRKAQCFELAQGSEILSHTSLPELTPVTDAISAVLAQIQMPGRDSLVNTRASM